MSEQKVAMVGTPCEIMAASKLQYYTGSPIDFKIGLFCMENFSYSYFETFLNEYDLTMKDIKKFNIDKGKVFMKLNDGGELKIPVSTMSHVVRKNCNICVELSSENSDLTVGSIGSKDGYSTVIVRTEKAEEVLESAIKEGYLEAEPLNDKQFNILNNIAKNKKEKSLEEIELRESKAKPVLYQREISDDDILNEISVSNFDDLRANVINVQNCVLCGACEYICPDNLISIKDRKPLKKKTKCPEDCHACFTVCPRAFIPDKLKNDNLNNLGEYKNIYTVRSLKDIDGQDGSVVTTLLEYLLEKDLITNAIVVDKKESLAWKPYAKITNDMREILECKGTKYSVCPIFKPLKELDEDVI